MWPSACQCHCACCHAALRVTQCMALNTICMAHWQAAELPPERAMAVQLARIMASSRPLLLVVECGSMAMSGLKCAAALCGCASSCAYERPYVSSYYQHACEQRMGAAAEHLQGRAWLAFLTLLLGVSM